MSALLKATPKSIVFENAISEVRRLTSTIAKDADLLAWLKTPSAALSQFDLRMSAQELRDAASRLDDLQAKRSTVGVTHAR